VKITALEVTDYKRVRKVAITPAADKDIILIGGKNAQGKSSILDALTALFGGKRAQAADPVRHGAERAQLFVELDGGKMTIEREIGPDGATTLQVRDPDGPIKAPQAALDKLVGPRTLDPLAFLALDAKEQRVALMKLIPQADRIDKLNESRERGFTRRTELGRDLKKAEGELARLPITDPGKPIDVAALVEQAQRFADEQRAGERAVAAAELAGMKHTQERDRMRETNARIADLEKQLAEARALLERDAAAARVAYEAYVEASKARDTVVEAFEAKKAERDRIAKDLARADQHNQSVAAGVAEVERRKRAEAEVAKLKADTEELTKGLQLVEQRKAEILASAKLPVEGLGIGDDGITFNGVPFAQASGAEQLRVALALAMSASPGLEDVWVKDGALLDEEHLELIARLAGEAGKRVWIERVGARDPGAIVIQDGQVIA